MATAHLHFQTQPLKPKRRRRRETTITASTAVDSSSPADSFLAVRNPGNRSVDASIAVCADNPQSKPPAGGGGSLSSSPSSSRTDLKIGYPPAAMDSYTNGGAAPGNSALDQFPSSLSKFNSALTAGLLSPPPPAAEKTRSSPTLFEMMANETDCHPRATTLIQNGVVPIPNHQNGVVPIPNQLKQSPTMLAGNPPPPPQPKDRQALVQQRLMDLLQSRSPGNQFNDAISGNVKLTLSSRDGISVSISVHRQILVAHSRFFSSKLNEEWVKQQSSGTCIVEIADCDDVEVYIQTLRLMYCRDLRKNLIKEDVPRVLGILKVSSAIGFDAGVLSCLEYLEAAPWAEDEEDKVASLLSELKLKGIGAGEVLKRVSVDAKSSNVDGDTNEEVLVKLLHVVLEGKDEKARREMKNLVSKMLHENSSKNDLSKESLYSASDGCLKLLRRHFLEAAEGNVEEVSKIARQADNLHWLLDILVDRQIAEDFLQTWASQSELSEAHSKVLVIHRYEISRVTARLFVAIGKGQLLASKEGRCSLLQTWLAPFYDDFGWMRRAGKGLDRNLVEEGLSNTILTLPMSWQQEILLAWFDRFVNSGDDCPNIQRGFEVWWRRAFSKQRNGNGNGDLKKPQEMRITVEKS
ncbi:BTB/POZ domain-containing protein At1g63850-like [Andrographis paniculata]|uniref:BTB/POZ domain-containing protein At1g63850-like n=1 Tax=Andrographis paniculata TaxID=175694 RepID=UPI0021E79A3F|nr:BTB/POZ domain-containing protein At1g63850-like [Andrographis paniculata]